MTASALFSRLQSDYIVCYVIKLFCRGFACDFTLLSC